MSRVIHFEIPADDPERAVKFYRTVFVPAIREAREQGKADESIRDSIRKDWTPA